MTRAVAGLAVAAATLAAATAASAAGVRLEGPFGRGAAEVWILVPPAAPRAVVVFGHGWKPVPTSHPVEWVRQFEPWLRHLAERRDVVVFPRYQLGGDDSTGAARVTAYRRGLALAFARLGRLGVPVVAAGYSYGGSLAFCYAASASRWRLPAPAAVDLVFPAGPIVGASSPPLPSTTRVLIQVGADDTEAGSAGASWFWSRLRAHPAARKRYVVVRSVPGLAATHAAPKQSSPAARHAFWQPLDALVTAAARASSRRS